MKRVLFVSDLHCGHWSGLTHPSWQIKGERGGPWAKRAMLQRKFWAEWRRLLRDLAPIDVCVVAGDCVDGRGKKSGGVELLTADVDEQGDMAKRALGLVPAKQFAFVFGTPYHTGENEDQEQHIADFFGAPIKSHLFCEVEGVTFDVKHKIGGSHVPHGRFTAAAREALWNLVWSTRRDGQPRADVIVRGHVHYYAYCGRADWLSVTLPCLQCWTRYGARQCSGDIDWGVWFADCENGRVLRWQGVTKQLRAAASTLVAL